jgi:hypothetical protein
MVMAQRITPTNLVLYLLTLLMIYAYLAIQSSYAEIAARRNQWFSCVGKGSPLALIAVAYL